jgi:hypothetical protein
MESVKSTTTLWPFGLDMECLVDSLNPAMLKQVRNLVYQGNQGGTGHKALRNLWRSCDLAREQVHKWLVIKSTELNQGMFLALSQHWYCCKKNIDTVSKITTSSLWYPIYVGICVEKTIGNMDIDFQDNVHLWFAHFWCKN